ncbi:histidine kinase [Nonomuraea soli]|uniref:Signal transduction histidine kinase n=1 Tax=Nonomuraea soli TaxID=1032476 RepID=A0A7W0HN30_9ACTN|nr:histidine kinase [Nonomuraea soli]MBA2889374.1 signal transduction histidine kinase [Nonomuraea soli]
MTTRSRGGLALRLLDGRALRDITWCGPAPTAAVMLTGLSTVLAVWGLAYGYALPEAWRPSLANEGAPVIPDFAAALAFPAIGAFILAQRPTYRLAWLAVAGGLGCAVKVSMTTAMLAAAASGDLELAAALRWPAHIGWVIGGVLLAGLLPLYLPDGKLPSRRWRWVVPFAIALMVVEIVRNLVRPNPPDMSRYPWPEVIPNPHAFHLFGLSEPIRLFYMASMQGMLVLALIAFVVRARRGDALVRRQIAWPAAGYVLYVAGIVAGPSFWLPAQLGVIFTATSIAFSVLKHRLLDIDVLVGRAVVGGGIFAAVAAVYLGVSALAGLLVSEYDSLAGLAAAMIAGIFFQPLRLRLRSLVDQAMYGTHGDPRRLARRLAAEVGAADPMRALGAVAEVTMDGLGTAGLAIRVRDGRSVEVGREGPWSREVPLVWHGEPVGTLLVGPPGARHFPADYVERLIAAAVPYAADVAHAVRVSTDLQHSREHILATREEERRRLRGDLHDGLAPALARMAGTVDVAVAGLRGAPADTERLLADLHAGMDQVAREVRELVHGLHPTYRHSDER